MGRLLQTSGGEGADTPLPIKPREVEDGEEKKGGLKGDGTVEKLEGSGAR